MKSYKVKGMAIFHNGKRYGVGEAIDLDDATAAGVAEYLTVGEDDAAEAKAKEEAKGKTAASPKTARKGK